MPQAVMLIFLVVVLACDDDNLAMKNIFVLLRFIIGVVKKVLVYTSSMRNRVQYLCNAI
jgi:hypothetical protein